MEKYEKSSEEEMSLEPGTGGSRFWVLWFWVLVLGSGFGFSDTAAQERREHRTLSCEGPFDRR